ncbi:MAG: HD domain-containing protein [Acidobacteriaceae bacterium]
MVSDLAGRESQNITGFFAAGSKQVRSTKDGARYFALTLCDRTGQIEARMWEIDGAGDFETGDVVAVKGHVCRFNEKLQIKVDKVRRADERDSSRYALSDFVPQSERDIEAMWAELEGWVAGFSDLHFKSLLEAFLGDPEIAAGLREAPAAKGLHHAWIGGLLEHILSLMAICDLGARHYPGINRDLLLTGVVLHDIGKLRELHWGTSFDYTIEGQLLGHITIGLGMIEEKIAAIADFPPAKRVLVEHLVLSHHGKYEFGSPKLPMTPEAILLHYLDDLDAKMQTVRAELARNETAGRSGAEMTDWIRSLERPLLNTQAYLDGQQSRPSASESDTAPPPLALAPPVREANETGVNASSGKEPVVGNENVAEAYGPTTSTNLDAKTEFRPNLESQQLGIDHMRDLARSTYPRPRPPESIDDDLRAWANRDLRMPPPFPGLTNEHEESTGDPDENPVPEFSGSFLSGCAGKESFHSEEAAYAAQKYRERSGVRNEGMRAYQCDHCDGWHLGHSKSY